MNDLTFGLIYSRIMESRHLSLNNTIINYRNYRQQITSTIDYIMSIFLFITCIILCNIEWVYQRICQCHKSVKR